MKSLLSVLVAMLALTAGATEIVLVEGSVPEDASIGLAGVQYKVLYDDATGLITFMGKGDSSADDCRTIFHAISVEDDAKKSVTGYNGNCGHTPGGDVLMTNAVEGWLAFSINAADYTPNLGMFLTVVLRQDDARNLERFFGINSMMAPNDWAGFDGSWTNRIKITVPDIDLDGQEPQGAGLVDVPDGSEVNPGVWLVDNRTRLLVRDPGLTTGNCILTWVNPSNNKKFKLREVVGGSPTGGWLSSPVTIPCSGSWPKTYAVKTTGSWSIPDRVDVVMSHTMLSLTDTVRLTTKVDIVVNLEDQKVNGVRSGLKQDTLKLDLNGNVIPSSNLTLQPTTVTVDGEQITTKLKVTYVPSSSELNLPGSNTVKVDIDDMVSNHMDQVVNTFQLP